MIFEKNYQVQIKDVGVESKAKNKAILGYMEDVASLHSEKVGYGLYDIPKTKLTWLLLDWKLQVIERPKYPEEINVKTWSRYIERFYAYRDFEIYNKSGKLLAIATSKWVLIDTERNRVTKVTDEVAGVYESETEKSVFNLVKLDKIKEPENYSSKYEYTISRRDIDVYKHMHNLYYLDLAYETLPEDVYKQKELNNVRIHYKKETKLGEHVTCLYSYTDKKHVVAIKVENNLHAIIELW